MKKESEAKGRTERYLMLDVIRGFGVLLMIIFHGAFDLNSFGFASIDFYKNAFWYAFPRFIVTLFLICVGMGLALVHKNGIRWISVRRRFYKIGGWSLVITLVTFFLFRENFVYFGILHCIAVTSVLGVFFVRLPKLSLMFGLVLVASHIIFQPELMPMSEWLNVNPMDHIPPYPWFGVVLFGIFLESVEFHRIPLKSSFVTRPLEVMGRHSLKIYLLHRPIIFGFFLGLSRLNP